MLQGGVESGVLDSNADISGQSLKEFDILAREIVALDRLTHTQHGNSTVLDAARDVVVQFQLRNRRLRCGAGVQHLVSVFEEEVSGLALIGKPTEEIKLKILPGGDTERLCQEELLQVFRLLAGKEDRETIDEQRVRKPVDHGREHGAQVGFRVQIARKFHQRAPVVVAFAVEDTVEALLDDALDRIEQKRGNYDSDDQSPRARIRQRRVHLLSNNADHQQVQQRNNRSGERIRHAALEDEVNVHQAIADDRVSKGQRQEHQREDRDLHRGARVHTAEIGNHVENRVRRDSEDRSARYPLHLLPQERGFAISIRIDQYDCRQDETHRRADDVKPVQIPKETFTRGELLHGYEPRQDRHGSGNVQQGHYPSTIAQPRLRLREGKCEMQEESALQHACDYARPENDPIESVKFRRVVEGV